jgi:hypothetical protein
MMFTDSYGEHGSAAVGFGRGCTCAGILVLLLARAAGAADVRVPADFASIQGAIDHAASGDRVLISPGRYTEDLVLRSGIDVRGLEAARVLLVPASRLGPTVSADGVTDVVLANLTFLEASTAVRVSNSNGVTIANNVFVGATDAGVRTGALANVDVLHNVFFENSAAIARSLANTHVVNNIFAGNRAAIAGEGGFGDNNVNVSFNCFFQNGVGDPVSGTSARIGDPLFVDSRKPDFHLKQGSACIDSGTGTDIVDASIADAGAYGGGFAEAFPYPVPRPEVAAGSAAGSFEIHVVWQRNLAYLVTSTVTPGGYRIHYGLNASAPPFGGTDAGGGTQSSPIDVGDVESFTLASLQPVAPAGAAPQLVSAAPRDHAVVLTWTAVADAVGYRVVYGVASVDENHLDVGATTTQTVTGLANDTAYRFAVLSRTQATYRIAVTALDSTQNHHESAFSETAAIALGPVSEGLPSNELVEIPGETIPVPNLPDEGGCFIATAAYGSDTAAPVLILRDFRDRVLLHSAPGRAFVRAYYDWSPALSRRLDGAPQLKGAVRALLAPLVFGALLTSAASGGEVAMLVMLSAALVVVRWRARARGAE